MTAPKARPPARRPQPAGPTPTAAGIPVHCAHRAIVDVKTLQPNPRNPNHHPQEQIELFAKVVQHLGWRAPIVVSDRSGFIVKGHGKLAVATFLELSHVPIDVQHYATEADEWQDLLADNRIAELSERQDSEVAALLKDLSARGAQIEFTGYEAKEVRQLLTRLARDNPDNESEPALDQAATLLKRWKVKPGQIWQAGPHLILCGDATAKADVASLYDAMTLPPPALMVTDPPYGVDYKPDWRYWNKNAKKKGKVQNDGQADWSPAWQLFRGDVAYVWHAPTFSGTVNGSLEQTGFEIRGEIIWNKDRFVLSRGNYHWKHESCSYAVRKGATAHWTGQRDQSTVWDMPAREEAGHGHATPKPVMAMRRPIENNTLLGEGVYDPFLGSGTTLIAAEQTGRVCYAIEISPAYVAVALQRWADFTHQTPTLRK